MVYDFMARVFIPYCVQMKTQEYPKDKTDI